jgi:hypothetical protein
MGSALESLTDMPLSASTISAPLEGKWRRFECEILAQEALFSVTEKRLRSHG